MGRYYDVIVDDGIVFKLLHDETVQNAKQYAAKMIAAKAKADAPVGTGAEWDRHPGEYRDSIHASNGVVLSETDHSSFVEFGVPSRGIPAKHILHLAARSLGFKFKGS